MTNLDKEIEEKILAIVEKYQKEGTKLLNYLIIDDEITFFSPVANGSQITAEDLQKVASILDGSFRNTGSNSKWVAKTHFFYFKFYSFKARSIIKHFQGCQKFSMNYRLGFHSCFKSLVLPVISYFSFDSESTAFLNGNHFNLFRYS